MIKIKDWINKATIQLAGTPSPRLDCLILLEDITKKDRAWLLANPEYEISNKEHVMLNQQIDRRAKHEPLAYIRGKSEFFKREFIVSPATLQPRPETETILESLINLELPLNSKVGDIGTGSGCIAVTAKLERPDFIVHATEIDKNALEIAQKNAAILNADVNFYLGNLIEPLLGSMPSIILANLPYVPDDYAINQAATYEPMIAIYGGKDGLDLYRMMFSQIKMSPEKPTYLITESLPQQHKTLSKIANQFNYKLKQKNNFIQTFVLEATT